MLAWHRSAVFAHHRGDAPDLRYVTAGGCPEDLGGWCFCQGPWLGQQLQYPPDLVPLLHWLPRADEIVRSVLETTVYTCVGGFRGWLLVSYQKHTSTTTNVLVIYLRFPQQAAGSLHLITVTKVVKILDTNLHVSW